MINSETQLRTAKRLGKYAWEQGKIRVPAKDQFMLNIIIGRNMDETPKGEASTMDIFKTWREGWDEAKLNGSEKTGENMKYDVGDIVGVKWDHRHYDGKSVRRNVMDDMIEWGLGLPVKNAAKYVVGMRYMLNYKSNLGGQSTQLFEDFQSGERHALPKITNEKRGWIRKISETIDQFDHAVVIGVELCPPQLSKNSPSHLSYQIGRMGELIKYKLMVVGKNECTFKIEVLTNDIRPLDK